MADLTLVRVTVNLVGAKVGSVVSVDLDDSYMQMCLDKGYIVPVESAASSRAYAGAPTGAVNTVPDDTVELPDVAP